MTKLVNRELPQLKPTQLSKALSESQIQRQICDWLKLKGIFHWRANTGGAKLKGFYVKFGMPGCADIVGIRHVIIDDPDCGGILAAVGQFLAIECKAAKGKLSTAQQNFRDEVTRSGGLYILARNLQDVRTILEG